MERATVNQANHQVSGDRAAQARIEAQNAAQWLARLAHSYSELPLDLVQLRWDVAAGRIVTPDVAPGVAVNLSLSPLTLQFEEEGQPVPHPIEVDGKSSTEVEAWVLVELLHRGFDRDRFSKTLPYDPPHLMSGDATKYSSDDLADELRQLQRQFEEAAEVLQDVKRALIGGTGAASSPDASADLVCSPEHFDIAFVVPTFGSDPNGGFTKVGFTAGDDRNPDPRYFVTRERAAQDAHGQHGERSPEPIASRPTNRADLVSRLVQQAKDVRDTAAN